MSSLRICALLGLTMVCAACGFQLREDSELPPEMAHTRMVIDDEYNATKINLPTAHLGHEQREFLKHQWLKKFVCSNRVFSTFSLGQLEDQE